MTPHTIMIETVERWRQARAPTSHAKRLAGHAEMFGKWTRILRVPIQHLQQIAAPATEHEQMPANQPGPSSSRSWRDRRSTRRLSVVPATSHRAITGAAHPRCAVTPAHPSAEQSVTAGVSIVSTRAGLTDGVIRSAAIVPVAANYPLTGRRITSRTLLAKAIMLNGLVSRSAP